MSKNKTVPDNVVSLRDGESEPPYTDSDIKSFIKILTHIQTMSSNLEARIVLDPTFITFDLNNNGNRIPELDSYDRLWNVSDDVNRSVTLFDSGEGDTECVDLMDVDDFKEIVRKLNG